MERILLIDGNSIMNRGYYGLPLLANKDGIYTNALLGFFNILSKTVSEVDPNYLCVAFDMKASTFRHKIFTEYKGTRKPAPAEFTQQLPIIREILKSMGIPVLEKEGYEADDILGTLAKRFEKEGLLVTVLSGDRDLLQIASDNITISIPKTVGGKTETFNYNTKDVVAAYGVTPTEFIDVKALQGDSSDNIPGVTKVGEKTAQSLIATYKSLEGVYEHIDDQKGKLKENLINDKEKAFLSRTLATIEINAPIDVDLKDCAMFDYINDNSLEILRKYELKSVISKLEAIENAESSKEVNVSNEELSYEIIDDLSLVHEKIDEASKLSELGIYACDEGVAVSFGKGKTFFLHEVFFVTKDYLSENLTKALLNTKSIATFDIKRCYDYIGEYRPAMFDCEILAYLIDPLKGDYNSADVAERYISRYTKPYKEAVSDKIYYSCLCAENAILCKDVLLSEVKKLGMDKLFFDIEMPLSFVLYSMEKEGVLVDKKALEVYSDRLSASIDKLEKKIYEQAGCEFNINSPKQLGEILFEKLGIEGGKKTKTGYSTAADVLEKLSLDYPIVSDILEYRTYAKLKSTYAEGLKGFIGDDGRIHTHFNQTITATGRISSTEPNLQNIPIRTELGRELRKVFYPKEGCVFVDADYSQIELRLMAHMSGDEKLIEAYKDNKDIHRATASLVFNKPFDEVTELDRRNAKAVNFGIIYGISSYGLSRDLSISMKDAKKYIQDYFETYPKVKKFMDGSVSEAKEKGGTVTLFGRIRPIPELKDSNFMRRSFGERVAMNAPLQGTAADIMKIAMINIFRAFKDNGLKSKLLIQVHDEVLVETYESELEKVKEIVAYEMQNAAKLSVSLEVGMGVGKDWYEAH